MMPIEAASLMLKPSRVAMSSVPKMPNCAAAPKSMYFGFSRSGPKSVMAPMPMNTRLGNNSLSMPAL